MIKVYVTKQSNYPVDTPALKKKVISFLEKQGIVSDSVVNVSIVGEKKMLMLAKKFLNEDNVLHNVLSFRDQEAKENFVYPPESDIHLGEIVICYPKVVEEANAEGVLLDIKIQELAEHGALHLMGIHHD